MTIQRLAFAKNYGVLDNKNEVYLSAIKSFEDFYIKDEVGTQFSYLKALYFTEMNNPNNKDDEDIKNGNKIAHSICSNAITRFKGSYGAQQCESLISQLEAKQMGLQMDKVLAANTNQKVRISYTNLDKVYFTLLLVPNNYKNPEYDAALRVKHYLDNGKKIKTWEQPLKDLKDYNDHSAELPIDPMPFGHYVLLVSSSSDLSISNNTVHYSQFRVSNFTYQEARVDKGTVEITVFDRVTGLPQPKVKVTLYKQEWNSLLRRNEMKKVAGYTTDATGKVKHQATSNYSYLYAELEKDKDYFYSDNAIYLYNDNYKPKNAPVTHFFLDRKIYRPGQTIYFKGIVTLKNDKDVAVVPNKDITIELLDVNYQKVSELRLKTNDYGSYSGQFTAPSGVLTGSMSLKDDYGSTSFRVEEYKRPKFDVNFKPV